jgi:hypothetical protein
VEKATAERVASQEKAYIDGYLEGVYGDEKGRPRRKETEERRVLPKHYEERSPWR